MGAANNVRSLGHGSLKAEGASNKLQIVVDGFRNANDGNLQTAPHTFLGDIAGTPERAIAADAEKDVYVHPDQSIDYYFGRLLPTARTEYRAAKFMNGIDLVRIENKRMITIFGIKPRITETDAEYILHSVIKGQNLYKPLYYVVETGAESSGSHNADARPARVVKNLGERTCAFKCGCVTEMCLQILKVCLVFRSEYALIGMDKFMVTDG